MIFNHYLGLVQHLYPPAITSAIDKATISNQTLTYPRDPHVIAPSHSSSLRHTISMADLGEEFESALRRAKDTQPRLGFCLGLTGAIINTPVRCHCHAT
jgi:hypothetical protein